MSGSGYPPKKGVSSECDAMRVSTDRGRARAKKNLGMYIKMLIVQLRKTAVNIKKN